MLSKKPKVRKRTWSQERGPGFPRGEGGAHTLDYGRGEGGQQHPETSVHPAFGHYLSVSGLACLLLSCLASCQAVWLPVPCLLKQQNVLLSAAIACCALFFRSIPDALKL